MNIAHRKSDGTLAGDIIYDLNCILMTYKKVNKLNIHQLKEMRVGLESVIKSCLVEGLKLVPVSKQEKTAVNKFQKDLRDKSNEKKRSTAKALQSKGNLRGTVQKGKKN